MSNNFNWGKFLTNFAGYAVSNFTGGVKTAAKAVKNAAQTGSFNEKMNTISQSQILINTTILKTLPQTQSYQMNNLAYLEKSLYFKNVLNLPKDMNEITKYIQTAFQNQSGEVLQKNLANVDLINLSQFAQLFQLNGKEAVAKLISAMASASQQGITDVSQLKEMMKLINASVSTASQNDSAQSLKLLMLMYLPWLPLKAETDYELEVSTSENKSEASESSVTVLITTKNFGNLKAFIMCEKANNVMISINCSKIFPKDDLKKLLENDAKKNSIQSEISFSATDSQPNEQGELKAQILMSNSNQVNQFLIIMANSLVKNTIEIDKNS